MTVVVGEAVVDLVPDDTGELQPRVGGSPLNVAVALAALGRSVTLISELGTDAYGDLVREHLHATGVRLEEHRGSRTPTATVTFDAGQPAYELDVPWALTHNALPARATALHFGSLAASTPPGDAATTALAETAAGLGLFVSYDPNLRTPTDRSLVQSLASLASVVKLSVEDAALAFPGVPPHEAAASLLGERTRLVVLTRGPDGAAGFTTAERVSVPAVPVQVVDTIGAGDAFTAGLLVALGSSVPGDAEELERVLRAATEVAAFSCSRPGAAAPSREQLRSGWPG